MTVTKLALNRSAGSSCGGSSAARRGRLSGASLAFGDGFGGFYDFRFCVGLCVRSGFGGCCFLADSFIDDFGPDATREYLERIELLLTTGMQLDTAESQILGEHLRNLLREGITVFLIDHDISLVLSVCDYLYVLDFGTLIFEGSPKEVHDSPIVRAAYLGELGAETLERSPEEG